MRRIFCIQFLTRECKIEWKILHILVYILLHHILRIIYICDCDYDFFVFFCAWCVCDKNNKTSSSRFIYTVCYHTLSYCMLSSGSYITNIYKRERCEFTHQNSIITWVFYCLFWLHYSTSGSCNATTQSMTTALPCSTAVSTHVYRDWNAPLL
jgi:hypothetical protein